MRKAGKRPFSARRFLVRVLALPVVLLAIILIYITTLGLPDWGVATVTRIAGTRVVAVEADAIKLDLFRGMIIDGARVYRKGVVGPPLGEAERVVVGLDLFAPLRGEMAVRKVNARNSIFRPEMASGPAPGPVQPLRKALVSLEAENCMVQGVEVLRFTGEMHMGGYTMHFEEGEGELRNGELTGDFRGRADYDLRTKLCSGKGTFKMDPNLLLPMLEARNNVAMVDFVRKFEFRKPPRCEADFELVSRKDAPFSVDAEFWAAECSYKGVDILRADGRARIDRTETNSTVHVSPLLVVREEGIAQGSLSVYPDRKMIEFDGSSWLDPEALGRMAGILSSDLEQVRFSGSAWLRSKGTVDYEDLDGTELVMSAGARDISAERFFIDRCSMEMVMKGRKASFNSVRGNMYGGEFWGQGGFDVPGESGADVPYVVDVGAQGMNFAALAGAILGGHAKDYRGTFSGHVRAKGMAGTGTSGTVKGRGVIRIRKGRVFMLPVFGGLSRLMTNIIPGLDFILRQGDATAEFTMDEGKISTDRVKVEGDVLSLRGDGECSFDGNMDYDVQLTLMKEHTAIAKLLRLLTYPVSKLLEFRVRGNIADPVWYPVNFSPDLLERLGLDNRGRSGSGTGKE